MKYIWKYLAFMALPVKKVPDPCYSSSAQLLQPVADSSPVSEGEEPQVLPSAAVRLHNTLQ